MQKIWAIQKRINDHPDMPIAEQMELYRAMADAYAYTMRRAVGHLTEMRDRLKGSMSAEEDEALQLAIDMVRAVHHWQREDRPRDDRDAWKRVLEVD